MCVPPSSRISLAPSFDFLSQAFIPLLKRMGAQVDLHLERPGYFPAGGGLLRAVIRGGCKLDPLVIEERGEPRGRSAWASVAGLPRHIGDREIKALLQRFDLNRDQVRVEEQDPDWGPGNVLQMRLDYANVTEVFTGYGQKGRRAERIAQDVLQEVRRYLKSNAPIGEHLADQIMLPLALAGGGRYRTLQPSLHTRTQATMIGKFLDVPITFKAESEVCWLVCIGP